MIYHDPTCEGAQWLEQKEKFRNVDGCGACKFKGFMAWGRWTCKLRMLPNRKGYCFKWKFED